MWSIAAYCSVFLSCGSAVPMGPLRMVPKLAQDDLLEIEQPVLVHSPHFHAEMRAAGLENFTTIREAFGESEISVREGGRTRRRRPKRSQRKLADAIDEILSGNWETAPAVRESDGRQFFLSHFNVYRRVTNAFADLLPFGYRRKLRVKESDRWHFDKLKFTSPQQADDLDPDEKLNVAMFGAPKGYKYTLHADMHPVLLYHLDGPKRIWLYPRDQSHLLYLRYTPENLEGVSPFNIRADDEEEMRETFDKYPAFEKATPMQLDLRPGEILFIPCGWAHLVFYPEASVSVACHFTPDWFNLSEYWRLSGCLDYTQRVPYLTEEEIANQCWSSDHQRVL